MFKICYLQLHYIVNETSSFTPPGLVVPRVELLLINLNFEIRITNAFLRIKTILEKETLKHAVASENVFLLLAKNEQLNFEKTLRIKENQCL